MSVLSSVATNRPVVLSDTTTRVDTDQIDLLNHSAGTAPLALALPQIRDPVSAAKSRSSPDQSQLPRLLGAYLERASIFGEIRAAQQTLVVGGDKTCALHQFVGRVLAMRTENRNEDVQGRCQASDCVSMLERRSVVVGGYKVTVEAADPERLSEMLSDAWAAGAASRLFG